MNIPFDRQIWNAKQCAEYLDQAYQYFMRKTQYLPGFPPRCPIPGHPRWQAKAITEWALGEYKPEEIPAKSRQSSEEARIS